MLSSVLATLCQAPDSKREQFRRYLEKAGVVDSLTKGKQFCYFVFIAYLSIYCFHEPFWASSAVTSCHFIVFSLLLFDFFQF